MKRDFLKLADLSLVELQALFARAQVVKRVRKEGGAEKTLEGKTLGLIFEKHSTRTRLSFEAAMFQLGGAAITLPFNDSQMSRGEPLSDTARVVSRYVDAIMVRTYGDDRLAEFARYATVPVINGLSDGGHPVQLLADLFTIEERLGRVAGKVVTYVGDAASNMGRSWVEAAGIFGFTLRIAAPVGYRPAHAPGIEMLDDPKRAVSGADVIATDVWTSMGQEAEAAKRRADLKALCVDEKLLALAKPECIVLHCLPAHRGEEITDGVIESKQSAIFDEAENRMHVQKALLERLLRS